MKTRVLSIFLILLLCLTAGCGKAAQQMKNHNKGKRRVGRMQHTTAFGRLMICQCGNKFNLRFHSRDGRTDGVDYQCYTSVNRGSVAKRLNKGISIEHSCESPYFPLFAALAVETCEHQQIAKCEKNADKIASKIGHEHKDRKEDNCYHDND